MKKNFVTQTSIASSIAALLLSPAFAIEAPTDNSPPPVGKDPAQAAKAEAEPEKAEAPVAKPFIGLKTSPLADMVAEHLGIEAGKGVAVEIVAPEGPAAQAGIQTNDIITRVGGEAITSHEDLAGAVGNHKPGDKIRLSVIQKGKVREIDVTIGTRPAEADMGGDEMHPLEQLPLEGIPKELADRIRKNIKGNGIQLRLGGEGFGMMDLDQQLGKEMENMRGAKGMKGMFNLQGGFQSSVSFSDGEGSVEMKTTKDGKEITVKDKDRKIIWSGPWDSEQDKEAAPPDVRKRIDAFNLDAGNAGGMLNIIPKMINPDAAPEDDEKAAEPEAPAADTPKDKEN